MGLRVTSRICGFLPQTQTGNSGGQVQPRAACCISLFTMRSSSELVRQASRKCDIAYEFADGSVAYDDIPDPLPFDVNAPVIDIHDDDFGIWYMDCQDEPQKYTGKTVKFLAQVCQTNRAGKNSFVPGRFAMTCCVQDIQFVGFPCSYDGYKALEQRSWVRVTAKVSYKFHNIYRGKGPVLTAISVEPAEKPLNEVVTFS